MVIINTAFFNSLSDDNKVNFASIRDSILAIFPKNPINNDHYIESVKVAELYTINILPVIVDIADKKALSYYTKLKNEIDNQITTLNNSLTEAKTNITTLNDQIILLTNNSTLP